MRSLKALSSRVSNNKKAPTKRLLSSLSDDEEPVIYRFLSSSSDVSSDHEPIRNKYIKLSNEDSSVSKPIIREASSSSDSEDINNQIPPSRSMLSISTNSENQNSADMKDLIIDAQYYSSDDNKKSESVDQKQSNATDSYSNDSNNQKQQLQSNNSYESQNSESIDETKKYIGAYSSDDNSSNDFKEKKNNAGVYSSTDHQNSESEDKKRNNAECYPSIDSESNDSKDNRIPKQSVFLNSMDSTESESSDSMNETHNKISNLKMGGRVNPTYKTGINCKKYNTESSGSDNNPPKAVIIKPQGRKQKDPANPMDNSNTPRKRNTLCNESKNPKK